MKKTKVEKKDGQSRSEIEIEMQPISGPASTAEGGTEKSEKTKKELWDGPKEVEEGEYGQFSDKCYQVVVQTARIVTCVITAGLVLFSAAISKGLVLFMTSQITPNKQTPFCNRQDESSNIYNDYKVVTNDQEQAQWMWNLFFTFVAPQVFVFLNSVKILLFRKFKLPLIKDFMLVAAIETLHTVGMCMFVFITLPELDIIRGAMLMNCVSFIPALLTIMSRPQIKSYKIILDIMVILSQLSGFFLWPFTSQTFSKLKWATPVSLTLISICWWTNYAGEDAKFKFIRWFHKAKRRLDQERSRHFVYCFVSVWKIAVFFTSMILFVYLTTNQVPFLKYPYNWSSFKLNVTHTSKVRTLHSNGTVVNPTESPTDTVMTTKVNGKAPLITWIIQMSASFVCHFAATFACRIRAQKFCFSLPLTLVVPVTVSVLVSLCGAKNDNVCCMRNVIPDYLFWQCPTDFFVDNSISTTLACVWFAWFLSQIWISIHIWAPVNEHLLSTDKLFSLPLYSGILVDQSLILNRKIDKSDLVIETKATIAASTTSLSTSIDHAEMDLEGHKMVDNEEDNEDDYDRNTHNLTRIYACATMWHETLEEMIGFFISVLRMDKDRFIVRYKRVNFNYINQDYYVYETHIFFDDAFKFVDPDNDDLNVVVNGFVETMIQALHEAAKKVYKDQFQIHRPQKMATPYGGRMVWRLPGRTKLFVHLKDKNKIRHRKRWSQVMYMYYLLAYRLLGSDHTKRVKEERARHSFILALDGDIDFKPEAVRQVVTLMIKDDRIGAACGRIHPVGSGLMAWYQKFEYAVGHWLQKATEHVAGCVLCSPGCFSLFRGEALMQPNVMKTYTTKAQQASHYVQYDQGEDRWLCTLLLKQGFKVVYMAASHAYTHCPISFDEFYNQRRRWVPSTMANIVDLLNDRSKVVRKNENISNLYIAYQWMVMIGTVMGPGSIFLMLVSALNVAFGISIVNAMWINLVPLVVFILTCAFAKQRYQLILAEILTAAYALMMIGVLVATIIQIIEEGSLLTPSTLFTLLLMGTFVLAAFLHPREFSCLLYFLIYWLVIPSMYLLLIIYSLMNMHDVSWGTREVPGGKSKEQIEQERLEMEEAKKLSDSKSLLSLFSRAGNRKADADGSFGVDCPGLCSVKFCTHPNAQNVDLLNDIVIIKKTLLDLHSKTDLPAETSKNSVKANKASPRFAGLRRQGQFKSIAEEEEEQSHGKPVNDDVNPIWFKNIDADTVKMSESQSTFWEFLIEKYLKPLDENVKEKLKISQQLIELRNHMAYSFFMINIMFSFTIFLMQQHKDVLNIKWPVQTNSSIVYKADENAVYITTSYLEMEPIGTFIIFFFGSVLLIQLIGMIIHRWETFTKVMASTKVKICGFSKKAEEEEHDKLLCDANATQFIEKMMETKGTFSDETIDNKNQMRRRRGTVYEITARRPYARERPTDMEQLVDRRISRLQRQDSVDLPNMPRHMVQRLMERRNSIRSVASGRPPLTPYMTGNVWQHVSIPFPDYENVDPHGPAIPPSDYE